MSNFKNQVLGMRTFVNNAIKVASTAKASARKTLSQAQTSADTANRTYKKSAGLSRKTALRFATSGRVDAAEMAVAILQKQIANNDTAKKAATALRDAKSANAKADLAYENLAGIGVTFETLAEQLSDPAVLELLSTMESEQ